MDTSALVTTCRECFNEDVTETNIGTWNPLQEVKLASLWALACGLAHQDQELEPQVPSRLPQCFEAEYERVLCFIAV